MENTGLVAGNILLSEAEVSQICDEKRRLELKDKPAFERLKILLDDALKYGALDAWTPAGQAIREMGWATKITQMTDAKAVESMFHGNKDAVNELQGLLKACRDDKALFNDNHTLNAVYEIIAERLHRIRKISK